MRLEEIFEDVAVADIKRVEKALDKFVYQPEDLINKSAPVLDVNLPTNSSNHFVQRLNQRGEKAGFNLRNIYDLLKAARTDPSLGYQDELATAARSDRPSNTITIKSDEKFPLVVPVIVKPNPEASRVSPRNPVALDNKGNKVPKNTITPKTVFRKGIDD